MAGDPFTPIHEQNRAELQGGSIPQHSGAAIALPQEAAPTPTPDAGFGMPSFGGHPDAVDPRTGAIAPQHVTMPGEAFGPEAPEFIDSNGYGVQLPGLSADGQVDLAAGVGQAYPQPVPPPDGTDGQWTNRPDTAQMHLAVASVAPPAEGSPQALALAVEAEAAEVTQALAELVLAGDNLKIKCPKCDTINQISASGHGSSTQKCKNCDHNLSGAIKAKMANYSQNTGDDDVHLAVIFQQQPGMDLAIEKAPGGLVQKVICVTGTLALSPGPGQIDVEKPLQLTPDMFMSIKKGFDEGAFPHVTVPETHANGALENTGYVRTLEIKDAHDTSLPPEIKLAYKGWPSGTQLMLAGIEFTEPEVRQKALNGSIPDTSVGVKFNYRNKRSGATYPSALEHVALTPVPWVDGLTPFGNTLLSQQPFDADESGTWDGVYIDAPMDLAATKKPDAKPENEKTDPEDIADKGKDEATEDESDDLPVIDNHGELVQAIVKHTKKPNDKLKKHILKRAAVVQGTHLLPEDIADGGADDPQEDATGKKVNASGHTVGGILSPEQEDGSLPNTLSPTTGNQETETQMPKTVEELLAEQQARAEAQQAEIDRLNAQLTAAGTQLSAVTTTSWKAQVESECEKLQLAGCSPDFCNRVRVVKLAAGPQINVGDEDGLQLSVATGKVEDGKPEVLELDLNGIIDYLALGVPTKGGSEVTRMLALAGNLDEAAADRTSAEAKAKVAVDGWEKEQHPDRFNDDGTRKSAAA